MIQAGFTGSGTHSIQPITLELNGTLIFKGKCHIGGGNNVVTVNENSILQIGNNVHLIGGSTIISRKKVVIGNDCLVSWDDLIMDTDFHKIINEHGITNPDKEVNIGNNVWIGCKSTILKGTRILDNSIIASNSCVRGEYNKSNLLIGVNPSVVLRENISWEP